MYRLSGIILLLLCSMQMMLFPMSNLSCSKGICEIYDDCKQEDPDINAVDFVFEHLLNLESVIDCFEHEHREGERPHQPFQQIESAALIMVIISKQIDIKIHPVPVYTLCKDTYPTRNSNFISSDYLTDIFRPPSA